MKQALGAREAHQGAWHIGRFCSWLCGLSPEGFSAIEEPISQSLPRGITIQEATPEQLGEALKSAINGSAHKTEAIVKFVFSKLAGSEPAKAEVVIRAVIQVIPTEAVSGFVQIAARSRLPRATARSQAMTLAHPVGRLHWLNWPHLR